MMRPHLKTPAAVAVLVLKLAVTLILLAAGTGPLVAVPAGIAVGTLVIWIASRRAAAMVLGSMGGRPALIGEFPRLHNVVEGLCHTHGIDKPDLWVVDSPSGNAAVVGDRRSATIVVTTGATDTLSLVELEALMAQALVRCRDPRLADETLGSVIARVPGASFITSRFNDIDRTVRTDMAGAELTRYPNGMQWALRALAEMGTVVEGFRPANAHLWLLQPDGAVDTATAIHPTVELRVDALGEL